MTAIWQFIVKYEFWVLVAIAVGLAIAHEITDDATYASIMGLITIVAITRLAMHPMWKKDEEIEKE
jgi:uncharacterized membrane protein YhiD involved in acid resistance